MFVDKGQYTTIQYFPQLLQVLRFPNFFHFFLGLIRT